MVASDKVLTQSQNFTNNSIASTNTKTKSRQRQEYDCNLINDYIMNYS